MSFIFKASRLVPKIVVTNQKTIGVRIPDNNIAMEIVRALGRPILATSVYNLSGEYLIDPRELEKVYRNEVDLVIDVGPRPAEPSTIVDISDDKIEIIRIGKGEIFFT